TKSQNELEVHLFKSEINPLELPADGSLLESRQLKFRGTFRVDTGGRVYDSMRIESSLKTMNLAAVPPVAVRRMIGSIVLDGSRLAALWTASDNADSTGGL